MTGQMNDSVIYEKKEYSLLQVKGNDLFVPQDYGMDPVSSCTACWRGFFSRYMVKSSRLYLDELTISCEDYPAINGKVPTRKHIPFGHVYENVNLLIPFTGMLQIGANPLRDFSTEMEFQSPVAFEKVVELKFDTGILKRINDISANVEKMRQNYSKDRSANIWNYR